MNYIIHTSNLRRKGYSVLKHEVINMARRKTYYTVTVTSGVGHRVSRGRYDTKTMAKKALKRLQKSWRTDADTHNPRIKKYKGYV